MLIPEVNPLQSVGLGLKQLLRLAITSAFPAVDVYVFFLRVHFLIAASNVIPLQSETLSETCREKL